MKSFSMRHSGLTMSLRCNLKCKLCAAYSPYYDDPPTFSFEFLKKSIDKYFEVVDYVELFTLAGGEPLLYKDIDKVLSYLLTYQQHIGKIEIITNATVLPGANLQEVLKHTNQVIFLIDNYGIGKSTKVSELVEVLKKTDTPFRVRNYTSDNPHCSGWVDFGLHVHRGLSQSEVEQVFRNCAYSGKLGFCNVLFGGKMYLCAKSKRLEELGIQQRRSEEYLDFFDDTLSVEDKRDRIKNFENLTYLEACAYCNGLCENSERFVPAEQIQIGDLYEPR